MNATTIVLAQQTELPSPERLLLIAGWFLCGLLGCLLGLYKQSPRLGHILSAIVLSPLSVALGPITLVSTLLFESWKICSWCRTDIPRGAYVCPHCGRDLGLAARAWAVGRDE
jgi:hypothetical protein